MGDDWDWLVNQYDLVGNEPHAWWLTSEGLLIASNFLCLHSAHHQLSGKELFELHKRLQLPNETKVSGVIKMLRGMAIEALLKGLWVDYGGVLAENGQYKKIPNTKEHDLLSLAGEVSKLINLDLSSQERFLLERLSISIMSGRYPIQRKWEIEKPRDLPTGDYGPLEIWYIPRDEIAFNTLVSKFKNKFKSRFP
jgi:hypothetical protein